MSYNKLNESDKLPKSDMNSDNNYDKVYNQVITNIENSDIHKERKLVEFSKKIMFFIMSTAFVVIIFAIIMITKYQLWDTLNVLITNTLDFAKIGAGFYSTKAMVENVFKHNKFSFSKDKIKSKITESNDDTVTYDESFYLDNYTNDIVSNNNNDNIIV